MIRSTRLSLTNMTSYNLSKLSSRLRLVEEQGVTGRKINRPSDDPAGAAESHRLYNEIENQTIYQDNAGQAQGLLTVMDNTLSSVGDLIVRMREIATAMSSETITANERLNAANEVSALNAQLLSLANTEVDGRHVFAGSSYNVPAFNAAGVYQGDNTPPTTRVGDNQVVDNGADGSLIFQNGIDIFAAFTNLLTALQTNNIPNVRNGMSDMVLAETQNSQARASLGAEFIAASDAQDISEGVSQLYSQRLDQVINIDESTVYLNLSDLRSSYESVLRVSATANRMNLFELL
jgi:flagellar hook-associated protein 3 FlgL